MNESHAAAEYPGALSSSGAPSGSIDGLLKDFDRHLEGQRGCAVGTRRNYRREARAFLVYWIEKCGENTERIFFPNAAGGFLSTDGANCILQQAVQRAIPSCPSLEAKRVSPHVIRHYTAMHLLQSGVDITVIALWLGHESLETTHGCVQADLRMKEQALGKLAPAGGTLSRFKPDDALLAFLSAL